MVLFEAGHTGCNVWLVLSGSPHKIIMEALVCPAESLKEELVFLKITYMYNLKGCVEKSPKWHLENFEVTSIETPLSPACSLLLSSLLSKRTSNNNLVMLVLLSKARVNYGHCLYVFQSRLPQNFPKVTWGFIPHTPSINVLIV